MTRYNLAMVVVVLTCLVGAVTLAQATIVNESIGCDTNNCVDIWRVRCPSAQTLTLCADACDTSGSDTMVVVIAGVSPAAIIGKGEIASGPGCTPFQAACVSRTTTGALTATVAVSVTTDAATGYSLRVACYNKAGMRLDAPSGDATATLVTDQ